MADGAHEIAESPDDLLDLRPRKKMKKIKWRKFALRALVGGVEIWGFQTIIQTIIFKRNYFFWKWSPRVTLSEIGIRIVHWQSDYWCGNKHATWFTCWASSRVGARMRAWHSRRVTSTCCRIAMEKVAVFPVPGKGEFFHQHCYDSVWATNIKTRFTSYLAPTLSLLISGEY